MTRTITFDAETYYDKEYSLSKITTERYIRDERFQLIGFGYKIDDGRSEWVTGSDDVIRDALNSLDIPNSNLICHNMAFDGAILAWQYGLVPKYYFDTLSMARPITGQTVGGSLAALAKKFMLGEKGKEVVNALGMRREDFGFVQMHAYGEYCKNDVDLTYTLFHILRQYTTPQELYIIDMMLRMYTMPIIELNKNILEHHLGEVQLKKDNLMARIDTSIGRDALMSNPKFAEVLQKLGVEPPMKVSARTGKETYAFGKTDVAFKQLLEHEDERVQAVVSARLGIKSTLEETRTEAFIGIAERGPLPIMLNYYGAHTGRASGGDKVNLQNLPRGGALRKAMQAPKGHKLVAVDSSQIEARVVAWLAGQDDLVQAFANDADIYSEFASDVYGRPINRKRKAIHPETGKEYLPDFVEGFVGKTCILGLGYGMGKDKFKTTLKIGQAGVSVDVGIDEANRIVQLYRKKYDKIVDLWAEGQQALKAMVNGYTFEFGVGVKLKCSPEGIELPNGMMVRYNNLRNDGDGGYLYDSRYGPVKIYGGKVIENVVQALARIVVFNQMAKIDQWCRKQDNPEAGRRYKVALTVHDEVVAVAPEDTAETLYHMMIETMSQAPNWAPNLPIACEGAIGDNYADCK